VGYNVSPRLTMDVVNDVNKVLLMSPTPVCYTDWQTMSAAACRLCISLDISTQSGADCLTGARKMMLG